MNSRILFCVALLFVLSACGGGNDMNEGSGTVTPPVTVVNTAPVAQAGPAQSVLVGATVTLDGSASSDANGDSLSYKWVIISKPLASAATLDNLSAVKPTFAVDVAGVYVATLIVNDGKVNSELSSVTINASVANAPPIAHAGDAQNIVANSRVWLDGSRSSDADGDSIRYQWTLVTKPAGSMAELQARTSAQPYFYADLAGTYEASLIVNDGKVDSAPVSVLITAAVVNAVPVAHAGIAQNVLTGATVTLDASGSSDANGDALSYQWVLTARPGNSAAALLSSTAVKPTFVADKAGTYVATLTVYDGQAMSEPKSVTVIATSINAAPVANAGVNQRVRAGANIVSLDGRGSSDADGDNLSYRWTFISVPPNSMLQPFPNEFDRNEAVGRFWANVPGTYVVSLVVNDGKVDSAPSTSVITAVADLANEPPNAYAGMNQFVAPGSTVLLSGLASADVNSDPLTYRWYLKQKPFGSKATLSSLTAAQPTFSADVAGDYIATLIVNDGAVNSSASSVKVTATSNFLDLYRVEDDSGATIDARLGLPYATYEKLQKSCSGACAVSFTVDTLKVSATGTSFMITNVTAVDSTGAVTPAIVGLYSGQVIPAGGSATFKLVSPKTNGATAKLSYRFFVAETGQSFVYNADFTSN